MALTFYVKAGDVGPAYEDFTTYAEVDPSGNLTRNGTSIAINNMTRGVAAGIYKDFGAGYFTGDFTFNWRFDFTSGVGTYPATSIFALTPVYSLTRDNRDNANTGFDIYIGTNSSNTDIITFLRDWVTNSADQTNSIYDPPKSFWYTLTRVGSTLTLQIYMDESRTTLYDTLVINNGAAPAYRYFYPLSSMNSSFNPGETITGTLGDVLITT